MMIGKSIPEYVFITVAIAALRLVAPLSILFVVWMVLGPAPTILNPTWKLLYACLRWYAPLEAAFFVCVYLPRRRYLQKAAVHPTMSQAQRQALFTQCAAWLGSANYPSGWFFHASHFRKENMVEWLLWALFSTPMDAGRWEAWKDEIAGYLAVVQQVLGPALADGYNEATPCMRLTLDPVPMVHRPLVWYLIVGVVDFVTCVGLYALGFRHYTHQAFFRSFPPRLLTIFSRRSSAQGLSYWYRPHRSLNKRPVLFLHGIGVGLFPYTFFLADLASAHPDVGIIVPEFLSISARITDPPLSRPALLSALRQILDMHSFKHVVLAAHSYGTVVAAQILRASNEDDDDDNYNDDSDDSNNNNNNNLAARIPALLLIDPIPFLLHLPDVAYNFMYRAPRTANEWLLWYFSSRDADVARTLSRHFFWAENILWREDLDVDVDVEVNGGEGEGGGRDVAVVLCENDQVVNAEAVRRYLTGEAEAEAYWKRGRLEVLCFEALDHAMIFNARRRWRPLVGVLNRFVGGVDSE